MDGFQNSRMKNNPAKTLAKNNEYIGQSYQIRIYMA